MDTINKNVNIIIINGLGACGKSTFCEMCNNYITQDYNKTHKSNSVIIGELSTVDYVKDVAKYCGWNGSKSQKDRIFLNDLKKALEKWDNSPVGKMMEDIDKCVSTHKEKDYIFFCNSRERYDHQNIRNIGKENGYNVSSILIRNPNKESNEVPELVKEIESCQYDLIIENNGTLDDLKDKAVNTMKDILGIFNEGREDFY